MKTSQEGIAFLKKHEGVRYKSYKLAGEKYYSIGVGHSFDPTINANTVWNDAQVDMALKQDLQKFEKYVEQYVKIPLKQCQFDALVSYTFNRGKGGIIELSKNSKTPQEYADNIVKYWGKAERYKDALIKRRQAERELFLGESNHVTAIPIVHPTLRRGASGNAVKELQGLLGLKQDGIFGYATETGVKIFQKEHGLEPDGVVGQKTWKELLKIGK
jgi:lysozyme